MSPIATFEKVSFEQYLQAQYDIGLMDKDDPDDEDAKKALYQEWERIKLPVRASDGSAGYDFYMPLTTGFLGGQSTVIATGIRCKIEPGWMLALFPRSGLGFKYGMHLKNTVGIIDSDYYNANNEGHIMAKIDVDYGFVSEEGDRFMQGVFLPYGLASGDAPVTDERHGGFGSTGR